MLDWGMPLTLVVRTLDESILTAEPLLFPELHCCDRKGSRLRATVKDLARKIAEQTPAFALHRRELPGEARVEQAEVTLAPPKPQTRWSEPLVLQFDVVRWRHGSEAYLAFVPALGIEVLAAREPELKTLIPEHITAALRRSKIADSLYELALTQRTESVALEPLHLSLTIKSPRQRERDAGKEENQKPLIHEVGLVLHEQTLAPAYEVGPLVERMAETLVGRNARSVLLMGLSGVGKTAAVHELVRSRASHGLGSTLFWSTSGSRLIAGMSGFGMWQQRCRRLCQEAKKEGAVLHLGNLIELMEVGRGGAGGQGIAGFLRPYLGRGDVLAIAECTPEQLPLIERENPHLLEVFHQIRVEEPSPETGRRILQLYAESVRQGTSSLAKGALEVLDRLHRRYATYSAYPGRPVRFLRNLLKDQSEENALVPRDVLAAFSCETGLPLFMLDPAVPLDLSEAREWFRQRIIGQERAIDLMIDLLATVKAALTRPRRPIASLLFIGPTGVGKTELAKALAEYFFGDRNRLTRFDMSEFASGSSVERLIGGAFGAEGLLTSKVREQPFSVILFDEFEKAHWGFFDVLLQVLGEGRLTDAAGRLADFSNAIVVMTSNLGAEAFGRGSFGLTPGPGHPDPERHFTDEVRGFLRPELFNRIDRIVPFLPLDSAQLERIARRELSLIEQRDGFRLRGVSLDTSADAVQHLTAKGYDVRYGARPLKRAIERELLAPLSEAVNTYPADVQIEAAARVQNEKLSVTVRAKTGSDGRVMAATSGGSTLAAVAGRCAARRRQVQRLQQCSALLAVQNQLYLLEREEQRRLARGKHDYDAARAERLARLRAINRAAAEVSALVTNLEDEVLSAVYGGQAADPAPFEERLPVIESTLFDVLLELLSLEVARPHIATIGLFGDRLHVWQLAFAYHAIAKKLGYTIAAVWFSRHGKETLRRHIVEDVTKLLSDPEDKAIGVAFTFEGPHAFLRFSGEMGIHTFTGGGKRKSCLVDTSSASCRQYVPPERVELPEVPPGASRREYDSDTGNVRDKTTDTLTSWSGRGIEQVLEELLRAELHRRAFRLLEQ